MSDNLIVCQGLTKSYGHKAALTGIDLQTSIFAIWSSMGNIGYGIGPGLGETGTYRDFPTAAKWVMILAMILGRLSLLAVFVVILPRFWRA